MLVFVAQPHIDSSNNNTWKRVVDFSFLNKLVFVDTSFRNMIERILNFSIFVWLCHFFWILHFLFANSFIETQLAFNITSIDMTIITQSTLNATLFIHNLASSVTLNIFFMIGWICYMFLIILSFFLKLFQIRFII